MGNYEVWPGGEWKTVREIGKGAFGSVYEIQREEFGKIYKSAMKVMHIPKDASEIRKMQTEGMNPEDMGAYYAMKAKRLSEEFALLSTLKGYTNIVTYEDHKALRDPDGIGWTILIRMELLTPVSEVFKAGSYDEAQVIRLGEDICRALELCHERDIIHRDIKLDNIFVNERGDFKLGDFGIARVTENTLAAMTITGTPRFMAPEVYSNHPYGKTADIYSLGMVMYILMNRMRSPFYPMDRRILPEDQEKALIMRMAGNPIPEPVDGSARLKAAVLKAAAYYPKDRYQSIQEFHLAFAGEETPGSMEAAYQQAVRIAGSAAKANEYEKAEAAFQILGEYKNSRTYAKQCRMEADRLKKEETEQEEELQRLLEQKRMTPAAEGKEEAYRQAYALAFSARTWVDFEKAETVFRILDDYKESRFYAQSCRREADRLKAQEERQRQEELQRAANTENQWEEAYRQALWMENRAGTWEAFENAAAAFDRLGQYMDSSERAYRCRLEAGRLRGMGYPVPGQEEAGMRGGNWKKKKKKSGFRKFLRTILILLILVCGVKYLISRGHSVGNLLVKAEDGDTDAMYELGEKYYFGKGVKKEYEQAAKWFKRASDAGDPDAMTFMGVLYHEGQGVDQDYAKALESFTEGAKGGNAWAMVHIGKMYYFGDGVDVDYEQAVSWFEAGAEEGEEEGMYCMGCMYKNGEGVDTDYDMAMQWFKKGAKAGDDQSMRAIGSLYEEGLGVEQDYDQALAWYQKAEKAGNEDAVERIEELKKKMEAEDSEGSEP